LSGSRIAASGKHAGKDSLKIAGRKCRVTMCDENVLYGGVSFARGMGKWLLCSAPRERRQKEGGGGRLRVYCTCLFPAHMRINASSAASFHAAHSLFRCTTPLSCCTTPAWALSRACQRLRIYPCAAHAAAPLIAYARLLLCANMRVNIFCSCATHHAFLRTGCGSLSAAPSGGRACLAACTHAHACSWRRSYRAQAEEDGRKERRNRPRSALPLCCAAAKVDVGHGITAKIVCVHGTRHG